MAIGDYSTLRNHAHPSVRSCSPSVRSCATAASRGVRSTCMNNVTILGLGAMGRALAGAFLAAGHRVTAWNRSQDRAAALVERGAIAVPNAADAVRASGLVVVCVTDHPATMAILEPLAGDLSGKVVVDLGTVTPERARESAAWAERHGCELVDGAIMAPTSVIGTERALIFYSGSEAAYERHRSTLAALAGNSVFLGPDHGHAALYDLALLSIFFTGMGSIVHAFAMVGADGIAPKAFQPYVEPFFALLGEMAVGMVPNFESHRHPGDEDNVRMEAAALAQIIDASRARGLDPGPLAALATIFDRAIAAGHGGDSFSSLIEVLR